VVSASPRPRHHTVSDKFPSPFDCNNNWSDTPTPNIGNKSEVRIKDPLKWKLAFVQRLVNFSFPFFASTQRGPCCLGVRYHHWDRKNPRCLGVAPTKRGFSGRCLRLQVTGASCHEKAAHIGLLIVLSVLRRGSRSSVRFGFNVPTSTITHPWRPTMISDLPTRVRLIAAQLDFRRHPPGVNAHKCQRSRAATVSFATVWATGPDVMFSSARCPGLADKKSRAPLLLKRPSRYRVPGVFNYVYAGPALLPGDPCHER